MKKKISFNVNAYTARLIGRENVASLDGAVLELVKNTYDADATKCILYYDKEEETLYLMDNGCGMNEQIIEEHWMNIGNSSKYKDYTTRKGRVQTGAKGIGRFALDRVGNNCTMYTKNSEDYETIEWNVDWSDFEREKNLTDVTATIEKISQNKLFSTLKIKNKDILDMLEEYFYNTGTIFKINNLSDLWNDDLIENIREKLSSLIPPDIENEFAIYLFNGMQKREEAKIVSQNIDKYDYKINFVVNEEQEVKISIHRNEFYFGERIDEIIKKAKFDRAEKEYFLGKEKIINKTIGKLINKKVDSLGKVNGTLYFNKIMSSKDDAKKYFYKDITGRKNYSDIFGGIKIYRDNFRVRPYGEKGTSSYDWLSLGSRNSGSAAIKHKTGRWRVAPNQILGIINISRMNVNLPDQANREGIVETPEFDVLKEIIIAVIDNFEMDRQSVGRKLDSLYEKEHPIEKVEKEIKRISDTITNNEEEKHKVEDNIRATLAQKVIENKDEKIKNLEDENRMLRNLATTGIVANQYIHETRQCVDDIGLNVTTTEDILEEKKDINEALGILEETEHYVSTLNSWFKVTISSIRRDKRNMKYTDVKSLLNYQIDMWREALKNQNINIYLKIEDELKEIKCFPYEIESIISNLISNSVEALRKNNVRDKEKTINIKVQNTNEGIKIKYKDNGEGLAEGYKENPEKILEAFETNRRNSIGEKVGTGMGMWIIRNIVNDYNGVIDLEENKRLKEGFVVEIVLNAISREV